MKKALGYFLISLPFIAIGVFCMMQDKLREFGLAILISIVILAILKLGIHLIVD